jgi:hypothetical protein
MSLNSWIDRRLAACDGDAVIAKLLRQARDVLQKDFEDGYNLLRIDDTRRTIVGTLADGRVAPAKFEVARLHPDVMARLLEKDVENGGCGYDGASAPIVITFLVKGKAIGLEIAGRLCKHVFAPSDPIELFGAECPSRQLPFVTPERPDGMAWMMADGVWDRTCAVCARVPSADLPLRKCSGCHVARYCSKECQAAHWTSGHKADCKALETRLALEMQI